jgi:glycosyltransferase involved in cell wall biosynthesis
MSAAATPDPEAAPDGHVERAGDPRALDRPEVSVLVPCWNAATSIGRALDSVLVDRDLSLECIVVDDGSTDGTANVVRSIAQLDPRVILVVSPENEGVSAARNRGLGVVRGTWLTFLDADDRLLPGGLAAMHDAAIRTDALAVVGQRIWSDGEQTWVSDHYDIPDIRVPGRKSLVANPGLLAYASATGKLVHRTCREDLWFSGRVLGDQPWTIRALLRAGERIEVLDTVVYEWTRPLNQRSSRQVRWTSLPVADA